MCDQTVAKPDRPDGKSYVDAVTAAGQRSRTLIYFILILTVLTFATERNDYAPDWLQQRYQTLEAVYACHLLNDCADLEKRLVKAGKLRKNSSDDEKRKASQIAAGILEIDLEKLGQPAKLAAPAASAAPAGADIDNWRRREFSLEIETMIKKDTDNDTITLPVLGSSIDINDLWIVSGGMMFFLLYFLRASQKQEERNIRYIQARKNDEFDDLVAMNQVLSPHSLDVGLFGKTLEWGFGLLPSFLYLYLAAVDLVTLDISFLYVGRTETFVENAIELLLVGAVVYNNIHCLVNQQNIRELIRPAFARLSGR
jgi:hypothetical protein